MTIPATGGAPQVVARIDPRVTGGSWGAGNVLLISDPVVGIQQVPSSGGVPARLLAGGWPYFLPDGKHFLFQRRERHLGRVDRHGRAPRQLIEAPARKPVYSAGHILFARNRTLMAQAFDPASLQLSGSELPVAHGLATGDPVINPADYSAGPGGLLVLATGGRPNKLVWRDRSGKVIDELASGDDLGTPRISPDGRRVAFVRIDRENMDIYVADLVQRSEPRRLTFDPAMDRYPIWSPDGATITFSSGEVRSFDLFRKASDGTGGIERLTSEPSPQHAMDWSADGKHLAFTRNIQGTDLMILPAGGQPYMFLQTNVSEAHSQFSPITAAVARVFVGRDRRTPRDLRQGLRSGKTGGRRTMANLHGRRHHAALAARRRETLLLGARRHLHGGEGRRTRARRFGIQLRRRFFEFSRPPFGPTTSAST